MFPVLILNLKRLFRSPYIAVSVVALVLIAVLVTLLPALSSAAKSRLSIESFFFLLSVFLSFVGALSAARTLSIDRRNGTLFLIATKPVSSTSLILGTFLSVTAMTTLLSFISFPLARLSLPIEDFKVRCPITSVQSVDTQSLFANTHFALSFVPGGCPLVNCAEASRLLSSSPSKTGHKKRILWLGKENPQILWLFETDEPAKSLILSAIVAHAEETRAHLSILHNGKSIFDEDVSLRDEEKTEFPLADGVKGKIVVAISLTSESEPIGFRLWRDEAGYETTGAMLILGETSLDFNFILCCLVTAIKAATLVSFGIFCASFLSPAVSSILAVFFFFLSNANQFILQSTSVLPSHSHTEGLTDFQGPFYTAVRAIVETVCHITPQLTLYSPETILSNGFAISGVFLLSSLLSFGFYIPVLLFFATLLHKSTLRRPQEAE